MKKLIYSMLTLLCVAFAFTFTSCGGDDLDDTSGPTGVKGSKDNPFNVVEAISAVQALTWTSNEVYDKTGVIYVKGIISRIAEHGTYKDSGTFGNATFYISYSGGQYNEMYCYRILYLGNSKYTSGLTDIKVGDEVVICGKFMNYRNETPETVANEAYLYSLNGDSQGSLENGDGSKENPYTAVGACNAVQDLTWTSNTDYERTDNVYVKGKISRIMAGGMFTQGGTYGNASFCISEDGSQNNEFLCFRILYFNNKQYKSGQTDIKVGDDVVVYGQLMNYQNNTPETVSGKAYLISLNGATDGGYGNGDGTQEYPYTVAAAINVAKALTWTSNDNYEKSDNVYVKGKIFQIGNNGQYINGGVFGNASYYISDDGAKANELYCFRILYFDKVKYLDGQTDVKVGDDVVICGKLMNYQNYLPETVANEAWLYSLNGATDGGPANGVSFTTNSESQTWTTATDATYGTGFSTTTQGLKIGHYKHTCETALVAPNANHVRIYWKSVLSISSTAGKKIKTIIIGCAPDAGTSSYCFDMACLEGGGNAVANKSARAVVWTGSANKVVLYSNNGQVRMETLTVEFE